ncbi:PIR protein CIR protein [Plasmodium vinckei vinckei]|uniref:PIR protein CIR protein n=1 Tax=Plasmodium vinckei vinckei TaxID=54757 RepID=A0A449BXG2_PLAVN|nr:PIR protein CIR protein [Plasmodium vinckei vinckei]VEV58071.1 PIR protein CIR protein [Plasmodium vinckei vinckei]
MDNHKLMCKYLNIADSYFNGKNVNTKIINKNTAIKYYCYNGVCKTNEASINAVAAYIFKQFKDSIENSEYNKYDEYLLMWLSDKLFEIHDKSEDKDNKITSNQAYETYLKKHKGILDYWNIFFSRNDLKEANLKYMSEFYILLNKICKTITDYEKKPDEITNIITNSTECSNQYISIYNDIPKCQSYLYLLNKLKGIYDDFRNDAIMKNDSNIDLATDLKKFTKPDGGEMDAVRGFKSYKFSDSKCKSLDKKITMSKKAESPGPQASSQGPDSENKGNMKGTKQSGQKNGSDISTGTDAGTGNPGSVSGGDQGSPGSGANGGGSVQNDQRNPSSGSSDPVSSTSGGSFHFGSSFLEFLFNGTEKFNKTSEFIQKNQQTFKDAKDKISNAYNNTVDSLKSVYNASSDYFNTVISNITTQLNQLDSPSKSGGSQPGSGRPPAGGNSNNQLKSPQSPSATDPTDPSNPPPKVSLQQSQSPPQSQPNTQQSSQIDPPKHKTDDSTNLQLVKSQSPDPNLKKKWSIFPTAWNGSEDCKPEITFMNTTLVCCTSEQCSLTGIPVTFVLIPIILLIVYKYLSFGSSKKSEKKNMKKVINFHDGKRKTKIISSNDKKKKLKPVINSVGGKKKFIIKYIQNYTGRSYAIY